MQELREVETRLGTMPLDASETNALLDRWKALSADLKEDKSDASP